jgi:hypothetical protein
MAEQASGGIGDILATGDRDFLVRSSGEHVSLDLHLASCIVFLPTPSHRVSMIG